MKTKNKFTGFIQNLFRVCKKRVKSRNHDFFANIRLKIFNAKERKGNIVRKETQTNRF